MLKNRFFVKKLKKIDICPILGYHQKWSFSNFKAPQNDQKWFFHQKKIPPRYYAYINHQKNFQSGLTSGSAGLRKNMRDLPLPTRFGVRFFRCNNMKGWIMLYWKGKGVNENSKEKYIYFLLLFKSFVLRMLRNFWL